MAYVDLNPIRARIVKHIGEYKAASGYKRAAYMDTLERGGTVLLGVTLNRLDRGI